MTRVETSIEKLNNLRKEHKERMTQSRSKSKSKKTVDKKRTGEKDIDQYLYDIGMDHHQRLEALIDEEMEKIRRESSKDKINPQSRQIINEVVKRQIHGVFKMLDHQNKGTVDTQDLSINSSKEVVKIF